MGGRGHQQSSFSPCGVELPGEGGEVSAFGNCSLSPACRWAHSYGQRLCSGHCPMAALLPICQPLASQQCCEISCMLVFSEHAEKPRLMTLGIPQLPSHQLTGFSCGVSSALPCVLVQGLHHAQCLAGAEQGLPPSLLLPHPPRAADQGFFTIFFPL
jgi:hypothetical protein